MVLTISSSKIILFNLNNLDEVIKINNFHFYDNEIITGIYLNEKKFEKIFYKNFNFHILLLRYYITKIINCISFL